MAETIQSNVLPETQTSFWVTMISEDASKYTLLKNAVLTFSADPEKTIKKLDNQPFFDSSSDKHATEVLNQVNPDVDILIIDWDIDSELNLPRITNIFSYIEDVFKGISVIILSNPTALSPESQNKIIGSGLSKNYYSILNDSLHSEFFVLIIMNHLKCRNEISALNHQIDRLNKERKELYKYFSEDVVHEILSQKEGAKKSASRESTIMFLDVRNFTGISEKLSPEQVVELLDLLFIDIVDLIFSYKGSVNKFIGDAILATFGCPQSYGNDAENAIKCAINLISALSLFNQVKPAFLKDDINIGIGVATGMVFAGNVGSYRKMEYTVIGDTVNLASRLQDMTKKMSCKLIIDSETYTRQDKMLPFKKTNVESVRGKTEKLEIYYLDETYFDL